MSDYDVTKDHQSPGPTGPDPRIEATKENPIMQARSHGVGVAPRQVAGESPRASNTLFNLVERLERLNQFAAGLHGTATGLNDRMAGPVPREDDGKKGPSQPPGGSLNYAHILISDIQQRLSYVEDELRRLEQIIGD